MGMMMMKKLRLGGKIGDELLEMKLFGFGDGVSDSRPLLGRLDGLGGGIPGKILRLWHYGVGRASLSKIALFDVAREWRSTVRAARKC
jgi:hypothetical protein